jgi:hypothetical protein
MPSRRLTRLRVLRGWRRYAEIIARAVEATIPDASVYLAGGQKLLGYSFLYHCVSF